MCNMFVPIYDRLPDHQLAAIGYMSKAITRIVIPMWVIMHNVVSSFMIIIVLLVSYEREMNVFSHPQWKPPIAMSKCGCFVAAL